MGHGHDDEPPYVIPDYRVFKVEGCKQLEALQVALAKKGLKDPWIRNEVWRYHPGFGTRASRARVLFTRGMLPGVILGAIAAGITFAISDDHGHGDHGHGGHDDHGGHGKHDDHKCEITDKRCGEKAGREF